MSGRNVLAVIVCFVILVGVLWSCSRTFSEQGMTRSYGGSMELNLEPNRKLVEITWKEGSLWYLTKAMKPEDEAEDYIFQEKDVTDIWEGTVVIHERKMSKEEYREYLETKELAADYYRNGNFTYDEQTGESKEVFITCDPETGTFTKIRDYVVDENGEMRAK